MRSEQRARRLDTTLGHILYLGLVLVALGGGAGLAVTHVHRFHLALAARRLAAKNNAWLAEQCRTPEFYANMREHSALCDEVALAEADALWLHALRDVFDGSRPCGEAGCAEALAAGLGWVFGRGVWALCAAGAGALALSWSVLAVQRALARGARRGAGRGTWTRAAVLRGATRSSGTWTRGRASMRRWGTRTGAAAAAWAAWAAARRGGGTRWRWARRRGVISGGRRKDLFRRCPGCPRCKSRRTRASACLGGGASRS